MKTKFIIGKAKVYMKYIYILLNNNYRYMDYKYKLLALLHYLL